MISFQTHNQKCHEKPIYCHYSLWNNQPFRIFIVKSHNCFFIIFEHINIYHYSKDCKDECNPKVGEENHVISLSYASSNPRAVMIVNCDTALTNRTVKNSWRFNDLTGFTLFHVDCFLRTNFVLFFIYEI